MEQTSLYKSKRRQTIRLPKTLAMPDHVKRVDVVALGRSRIITPAGETWDSWFDGDDVTEDFMAEREQPITQEPESKI